MQAHTSPPKEAKSGLRCTAAASSTKGLSRLESKCENQPTVSPSHTARVLRSDVKVTASRLPTH
eukprot:6485954-Amphidinium_carterae.2